MSPAWDDWGKAIWLNGEFFMELRHGPFHLRPFVGIARRVAYSSCTYVARAVGETEGIGTRRSFTPASPSDGA